MAASSTALKAAYLTEVNKIGDTLGKARATYALDAYIEALDAWNGITGGKVQSYSVGNRTFTYSTSKDLQEMVMGLEAQLVNMIYGTVTLADLNSEVAQPVPAELN